MPVTSRPIGTPVFAFDWLIAAYGLRYAIEIADFFFQTGILPGSAWLRVENAPLNSRPAASYPCPRAFTGSSQRDQGMLARRLLLRSEHSQERKDATMNEDVMTKDRSEQGPAGEDDAGRTTDSLAAVPKLLAKAMRRRGIEELTSIQQAVLDTECGRRDLRISSQQVPERRLLLGSLSQTVFSPAERAVVSVPKAPVS